MPGPTPKPVEDRFWSHVARGDECWDWRGYVQPNGYGQFTDRAGGRTTTAHRWAYEFAVGPIPAGAVVDHLCRNRTCVRPSHLEPVAQRENVLRGALAHGLTGACRKGHDVTRPGSTRTYRNGKRVCTTCVKTRNRTKSNDRRAVRASRETTAQ